MKQGLEDLSRSPNWNFSDFQPQTEKRIIRFRQVIGRRSKVIYFMIMRFLGSGILVLEFLKKVSRQP